MKAGLPEAEPKWLARWEAMDLYGRIRKAAKGRPLFVLHDGPPYANGEIHMGTGMNKVLKDFVVRSRGMLGYDAPYVPGWDCHGLPIEWKIEEKYRKEGKSKDSVPIEQLRQDCRDFANHWIGVQREQFKRLGCIGQWDKPYTTMDFRAEATIARAAQIRRQRSALSRLPSGDVVAGGEDRARRSRGRVPRENLADDLCEVSGERRQIRLLAIGAACYRSATCIHEALGWTLGSSICDLDDNALDHSRQPRAIAFSPTMDLRLLRGNRSVRRKLHDRWR